EVRCMVSGKSFHPIYIPAPAISRSQSLCLPDATIFSRRSTSSTAQVKAMACSDLDGILVFPASVARHQRAFLSTSMTMTFSYFPARKTWYRSGILREPIAIDPAPKDCLHEFFTAKTPKTIIGRSAAKTVWLVYMARRGRPSRHQIGTIQQQFVIL